MKVQVKRFEKPKRQGGKSGDGDGPKPIYAPCFLCRAELTGTVIRVSNDEGTRLYDEKCWDRARRR